MSIVDEQVDLSGYSVTFKRDAIGWTWSVDTPDGDYLTSGMRFIEKENAKEDALKEIKRDLATEKVDGNALRDSLH